MSGAQAKTVVVCSETFKRHDTGPEHPESSLRVDAVQRALDSPRLEGAIEHRETRAAKREEILLVHWERHYQEVLRTRGQAPSYLDPDTPTSADSADVAHLAVGAVLTAVDSVANGEARNGFAFSRPPGHHAKPDKAMGFCLFNNVAIAAKYLGQLYPGNSTMIIDFDVHHGNGTQKAFYTSPEVLFVSLHQFPFYPGTGAMHETGRDDGRGYTVNVPIPAGTDDGQYLRLFREFVRPIAEEFDPDFILASAGFDAHQDDPLGGMSLTEAGFGGVAGELMTLANRCCDGRLVCALEGGYDLRALERSVETVVAVMSDSTPAPEIEGVGADELLLELAKIYGPHWSCLRS